MKHLFKLKSSKMLVFFSIISLFLTGCNGKLPGGDARKFPANPEERLKKNLEEGRGFQFSQFTEKKGGVFEFASSNSLWRASLDTIDFMPLSSVNYSGGIIITDWYSENTGSNESVKISIRFLTNEIRSDALNIKVFNKKCIDNLLSCKITEQDGILVKELKREILKKATLYNNEKEKKKKE
jgi:hypothetical protein